MPEPQRPRVLAAVLQTLSEHGPCPTAFQASPAASYRHGDKIGRAAAGWWVCYAARLQITAFDEPDRGEVVHMGFHGEGVHGAEPFAWELSFVTDTDGVQSVVLVDHASYPRPLRHALQYYAISQCRDALLQGTAARLGQQIHARQGLRAVVHGVLAALGFADAADLRSQRAAYESQRARMPAHSDEYASAYPYARSKPPHVEVRPPPSQPAAYKMLDATPRLSAPGSTDAAAAFALASTAAAAAHAPLATLATTADGAEAGGVGSGLDDDSAELFGISQLLHGGGSGFAGDSGGAAGRFSYRAEELSSEPTPKAAADPSVSSGGGGGGGGLALRTSALTSTAIEDRVDSLRARMPERSTESLRALIKRGEL